MEVDEAEDEAGAEVLLQTIVPMEISQEIFMTIFVVHQSQQLDLPPIQGQHHLG